ncbi:MAG: 4-(cytidine 5'-diphospho)-2-C-methyl-D-erythritol kinase [Candidatus Polarisedimenticolia bacterium]
MSRLTLRAHAKINLNLRVLGRRPDRFHEMVSVVQTISLHDTLILEATGTETVLTTDDPSLPTDRSNLVLRAAAALPRPAGPSQGLRFRLEKRIPAGAGLGGGSSDAAAALAGGARVLGLAAAETELMKLAAPLGADVPYFLVGGTALLRGRGEAVRPLPETLDYQVLLVFPGTPLATRTVYEAYDASLTATRKISRMTRFDPTLTEATPRGVEEWVRVGNDLEPCARELCPAIGAIGDRMRRCGATAAAMTGSGSAVFGIFRDADRLTRAARTMEADGYRAWRCAPLGRQEYRRHLGLA